MQYMTVGIGGDYPTWKEALDALPHVGGVLSDDVTITQISDINLTQEATTNGIITNSNNKKVTFTSSRRHYGDPTRSWRTHIYSTVADAFWLIYLEKVEINNLHLVVESATAPALQSFFLSPDNNSSEEVNEYDVYDNLCDCNNINTTFLTIQQQSTGNYLYINVFNNKIWNNLYNNGVAAHGIEFLSGSANILRQAIFENNTIYGEGKGFKIDRAAVLRNNVAISTDIPPRNSFEWTAGCESYNNASSDDTSDDAATQSDNLINIVAADEFISLDPTSPDFLKPKSTGQLYNMGALPEIPENIAGIGGNPRPWTLRGVA